MHPKHAATDHPVDEVLAARFSPYWYAETPIPRETVLSLFEAARWAPSSFNEQPWRFIVATSDDPAAHAALLSCLVEANRTWAQRAPVLALGVVARRFVRNGKPNRCAEHDLGLAAGNLVHEASRRGLHVHMMGGILPDRAREVYGIPDGYDAWTALAVGHAGDPAEAPAELGDRDRAPRARRPLAQTLFAGGWEQPY